MTPITIILASCSNGAEAFVTGFIGMALLIAVVALLHLLPSAIKRFKEKAGETYDELSRKREWKKSYEYHTALLKLMEEGHPKKQAEDILAERYKLGKMNRPSPPITQVHAPSVSRSSVVHADSDAPKAENQLSTSTVKSHIINEEAERYNGGIDPDNALLGDVLSAYNVYGRDAAINLLMENGYNSSEADSYLNEYTS